MMCTSNFLLVSLSISLARFTGVLPVFKYSLYCERPVFHAVFNSTHTRCAVVMLERLLITLWSLNAAADIDLCDTRDSSVMISNSI